MISIHPLFLGYFFSIIVWGATGLWLSHRESKNRNSSSTRVSNHVFNATASYLFIIVIMLFSTLFLPLSSVTLLILALFGVQSMVAIADSQIREIYIADIDEDESIVKKYQWVLLRGPYSDMPILDWLLLLISPRRYIIEYHTRLGSARRKRNPCKYIFYVTPSSSMTDPLKTDDHGVRCDHCNGKDHNYIEVNCYEMNTSVFRDASLNEQKLCTACCKGIIEKADNQLLFFDPPVEQLVASQL